MTTNDDFQGGHTPLTPPPASAPEAPVQAPSPAPSASGNGDTGRSSGATAVMILTAVVGGMALLGSGERYAWNDVFEVGGLFSVINRPYDGDRETDLRLLVDLTFRF